MKLRKATGEVVTALTFKSQETLIANRGSESWEASREHLLRCSFLVAVRHKHGPWPPEGDEDHKTAFLVGKISDVVPASDDPDRKKIVISEYAKINIPDMPLFSANPIQYFPSLAALNIDPDRLDWQQVELGDESEERFKPAAPTYREMKAMIAAQFGVPVGAVEINIRL